MHKVTVGNKVLLANDGEILSKIFNTDSNSVEQPCGGMGTCKKCLVWVNGKKELACQYKVVGDIIVALYEKGEISSVSGARETMVRTDNMCFCLDIGTTTIALALVSLDNKEIVKVKTATNPQVKFGADVMSRIAFCQKNGVGELHNCLIDKIGRMVAEMKVEKALPMFVSANATMLHTFWNIDCSSMGVAPYKAEFLNEKTEKSFIDGVSEIKSLPSIHSFVGADIVSGLNFVEQSSKGKYSLLVDLGTNAEIVLFSNEKALCTSAAAGPCLEGANISCGVSAIKGAISEFKFENNMLSLNTIDSVEPVGICGTGLVDIIAELVKINLIDETGFLECEKFKITDNIYIDRKDVRQFQLAKSAICSGILALMKLEGIEFSQVEKVFISGGFSAKINVENACFVGLLPSELKENCVAVNNSSLLGTVKLALEPNDLTKIIEKAQYVDLSTDEAFAELFMENMGFFVGCIG